MVARLADYAERQLRERVFPYVRDVTYPAVKRKASEAIARGRAKVAQRAASKAKALEPKPIELEVVDEAEPVATEIEVTEPSIPMSRSDILLAQFQLTRHEDSAARLRWILDHAEAVDEDLPPELEQAMTLMLEGRTDALDDDQREAITVFLHRSTNPPTLGRAAPIEPEGDN